MARDTDKTRTRPPQREGARLDARFVLTADSLDARGAGVGLRRPGAEAAERGQAAADADADTGAAPVPGAAGEGVPVHVPGLLPGERATVALAHQSPHGRGAWATIVRRHTAATERVTPACAGYGRCGGCVLQHMDYAAQLRFKQQLVGDELRGAGLTTGSPVTLAACVPSPQELGYRSRVKLVALAVTQPSPRLLLGAYAPRSHEVIEMSGCRVNAPGLTALARTVAQAATRAAIPAYDEATGAGCLRYVLLREVHGGAAQVGLVVAERPADAQLAALVSAVTAAHPGVQSVVLHHNAARTNVLLTPAPAPAGNLRKPAETSDAGAEDDADEAMGAASSDELLFGPEFLWEELGSLRIRVSARSFLQVNRGIAARIYRDVAQSLTETLRAARADDFIFDLYCGVGGLGRTVQKHAPHLRLLGIESSPSAIADAIASAADSSSEPASARAEFRCGAVESLLEEAAAGRAPAVVLVNPPRRGCSRPVLDAVIGCAPRAIAYVSCSPRSLVRDLAVLCGHGYRISGVTPYDMHPGTPHTETVAMLERVF